MSIMRVSILVCDWCSEESESAANAKEIRDSPQWHRRDGMDLCYDCWLERR
jgi:hypothetical protein